jgi:hypothetical protein
MRLVLVVDGAGYLLAVSNVSPDPAALITALEVSDGKTSIVFRQRVRRRDVARSAPAATGSDRSRGVVSA